MLPVRVAPEAQRQIRQARDWWRANRTKAPRAFVEDLDRMLRIVRSQPSIGVPVSNPALPGVRRVLLDRLSYFLYYRAEAGALEILVLWHSSRGTGPEGIVE
jgi:plasmid stabilization system protein ParE